MASTHSQNPNITRKMVVTDAQNYKLAEFDLNMQKGNYVIPSTVYSMGAAQGETAHSFIGGNNVINIKSTDGAICIYEIKLINDGTTYSLQ